MPFPSAFDSLIHDTAKHLKINKIKQTNHLSLSSPISTFAPHYHHRKCRPCFSPPSSDQINPSNQSLPWVLDIDKNQSWFMAKREQKP